MIPALLTLIAIHFVVGVIWATYSERLIGRLPEVTVDRIDHLLAIIHLLYCGLLALSA